MKKHAKNTLEKVGELSLISIVGLLLVTGLGAAATLTYFAEIDGEANVEQAVIVDEVEEGEASISILDHDDIVAGTVDVSEPFALSTNLEDDYRATYTSDISESADFTSQSDISDTQFTWENGDGDVARTTYANYFPEAGASSDYSIPDTDGDEIIVNNDAEDGDYNTIEEAVDSVDSSDDVIVVEEGSESYNPPVVDSGETGYDIVVKPGDFGDVVIDGEQSGDHWIRLEDEDISFQGFVIGEPDEEDLQAISTRADGIEISNIRVDSDHADDFSQFSYADDDTVYQHNTIRAKDVGIGGGTTGDSEIKSNVFDGEFESEAVGLNDDDGVGTVDRNRFQTSTGTVDIQWYSNGELDIGDNFFYQGTWEDADNSNFEGDIDASYDTDVEEVPADGHIEVAAVTEVALMATGGNTLDLTTTIE